MLTSELLGISEELVVSSVSLNIQAARFSEIVVPIYKWIWHYILELFNVLYQFIVILSYSHVFRHAINLISSPLWNVMHWRLVVCHRCFRQPISPIFKSQDIQEDCLTIGWPERSVTNNHSTSCNIQEKLRSYLHLSRYWKSCSQFICQPHSPSGMWQYVV